jgi:hypothetical protein
VTLRVSADIEHPPFSNIWRESARVGLACAISPPGSRVGRRRLLPWRGQYALFIRCTTMTGRQETVDAVVAALHPKHRVPGDADGCRILAGSSIRLVKSS